MNLGKDYQGMGRYMALGTQMVLTTVVIAASGYWIDQKTGTSPVFLIAFFLMGAAAGTLHRPVILGVVFGVLIGGVSAALQIHELRLKSRVVQPKGVSVLIPGAVGRLLFVVVAWWLAFKYTEADKYWLTGALAVTYTTPLLVQLKQLIFPTR